MINNNTINMNPKESPILIVDDEATNVRLLQKMLSNMGYKNVISTQDPTQVLPLHQEYNFDLILLDINMPVLDGYGVMDQLNEATNHKLPPILVLTAQHTQTFRQRALDSGARDYVTKPFDAGELLSRVRNLLDVQMSHKYMLHQNEILEQKIQERIQIISDTRLHIVRCLGRAAEYRDEDTGFHIIRMSKISMVLAKASGMDMRQCDLILNAAPMHDLGKIGIPDHILLKPGKLEPHEWAIMQSHAKIGADILEGDDSDLMIMAREIALTHHEKWNGKGYPNGLQGDDIPLVGQICALADVFDALVSTRPYKKAWPLDKALALIKSESGQHFNPKLIDFFLQNLPEIIDIKDTYAEPGS
ncbi:MAG: response regulator [Emcibacter sp.]|nr:response regulator [Emcibacter sp.]